MEEYKPAKIDIVYFNVCDIITSSSEIYPDDEDYGGIGGGYNPDGWT